MLLFITAPTHVYAWKSSLWKAGIINDDTPKQTHQWIVYEAFELLKTYDKEVYSWYNSRGNPNRIMTYADEPDQLTVGGVFNGNAVHYFNPHDTAKPTHAKTYVRASGTLDAGDWVYVSAVDKYAEHFFAAVDAFKSKPSNIVPVFNSLGKSLHFMSDLCTPVHTGYASTKHANGFMNTVDFVGQLISGGLHKDFEEHAAAYCLIAKEKPQTVIVSQDDLNLRSWNDAPRALAIKAALASSARIDAVTPEAQKTHPTNANGYLTPKTDYEIAIVDSLKDAQVFVAVTLQKFFHTVTDETLSGHKHSFDRYGYCTKCGKDKSYIPISTSNTSNTNVALGNYLVKNRDSSIKTVPAWTEAKSTGSSTSVNLPNGSIVSIVKTVKNDAGNWWAQAASGRWIYSENLAPYVAPVESSVGSGFYLTTKANLIVYTNPSSYSSEVRKIAALGTEVKIVATHKNPSGNTWGKIKAGEWVHLGDMVFSQMSNSNISLGNYRVRNRDSGINTVPAWTEARSTGSSTSTNWANGTIVTIVKTIKNDAGNWWAQAASGRWIYSENLARYVAPAESSAGAGSYKTAKANLVVYNNPSSQTKEVRKIATIGTEVKIVATHKNAAGNSWGKIKAGEWVFMGDLK